MVEIKSPNYNIIIEDRGDGEFYLFFKKLKRNEGVNNDKIKELIKNLDKWYSLKNTINLLEDSSFKQTLKFEDFKIRGCDATDENHGLKIHVYIEKFDDNKDHVDEIKEYLENIEKWELITSTGNVLLKDMGLIP